MDFGIFGFSPEQVQEFRTFIANQQAAAAAGRAPGTGATGTGATAAAGSDTGNQREQQQQPDGANNNNGSSEGQQRDEPVLMHTAQHTGVMCDICNSEIRGFRYKCMQCPDFDLCSKCEHKGHHAGHIMMRISFPEQSRDAIRKYLSNVGPTPPPSPPHPGHHGFESLFSGRRGGHCGRRGGHGHGHGGDDSERPATAPGCPYQMGRKEFKKWSKFMKKASTHHHRSAEAYARAAAASGNAAAGASAAAEGEEPESPMDFGAVASQIQDFLNYWGVPVDVVELYDQFGNYGQPGAAGNERPPTNAEGGAGAGRRQSANAEPATGAQVPENNPATDATATAAQDQQPASPASAALTENLQQMRIDEPQNNPRKDESLLMDLDAENSGWTILNDSREQSPGNTGADTQRQVAGVAQGSLDQQQAQNQASVSGGSTESVNSGNNSTPFASAGSNDSNGNGPSAIPSAPPSFPSAPPTFPSGVPNVPLYPVLNPPQLQQILQGVSSAVSSVVRSIPIVTDPRGPMGTHVTNSSSGQTTTAATAAPEAGDGQIELDARSMKTLNQLLAMGFSNEGGYLTRLVIAKKGDLEAVLSSLFPN